MASSNGYSNDSDSQQLLSKDNRDETSTNDDNSNNNTLLAQRYPVNTLQEITLSCGDVIRGRVYCTDEITGSIVVQKSLVHTTLASEIRIIAVSNVIKSITLPETDTTTTTTAAAEDTTTTNDEQIQQVKATPLTQPLPKIQKKALEERERRAMKLAEDKLRHINQKASPAGQIVFDRLHKACGEAVWKGDTSILVLNQVQVDPPYQPENCKVITIGNGSTNKKSLEDGSLDRIRKIVAAIAAENNNNNNPATAT